VEDVARFLSKHPEEFEADNGMVYTWVDAFNATDRGIQTISRFMEVRLCCSVGRELGTAAAGILLTGKGGSREGKVSALQSQSLF